MAHLKKIIDMIESSEKMLEKRKTKFYEIMKV